MRYHCMVCDNLIEHQGDPFCKNCDPLYFLNKDCDPVPITLPVKFSEYLNIDTLTTLIKIVGDKFANELNFIDRTNEMVSTIAHSVCIQCDLKFDPIQMYCHHCYERKYIRFCVGEEIFEEYDHLRRCFLEKHLKCINPKVTTGEIITLDKVKFYNLRDFEQLYSNFLHGEI